MRQNYKPLLESIDSGALLFLAYWYAKACKTQHWWLWHRCSAGRSSHPHIIGKESPRWSPYTEPSSIPRHELQQLYSLSNEGADSTTNIRLHRGIMRCRDNYELTWTRYLFSYHLHYLIYSRYGVYTEQLLVHQLEIFQEE